MSKARGIVLFVIAAVALPLLVVSEAVAGGGDFPFYPGAFGFFLHTEDRMTAVIVLDPNGPVSYGAPATPTGAFGTITITKPKAGHVPAMTATAAFRVQPGSTLGELVYGCNLLLTNQRFVEFSPGVPGLTLGDTTFGSNWLSSDVTTQLLARLGITVGIPGIASVISQKCVPFPKKDETLDFMPFSEILQNAHIKPLPPRYPDLSSNSSGTDPHTQWVAGFLVLEVNIGLWE